MRVAMSLFILRLALLFLNHFYGSPVELVMGVCCNCVGGGPYSKGLHFRVQVADKYAPTERWHIDTVLAVLEKAATHAGEQIVASVIQLFAETTSLHAYTTQRLYKVGARARGPG